MKKQWMKQIGLAFALVLGVIGLVACGDSKKEAEGQPKEVTIGIIRVPNDKTVVMKEKYFDEYFADKGIKTKFMFFDSGVAANQAFSSGAIDFAEMGYTNGVVALATDIPVELVWIHEVLGTNEALVVQEDSNINKIEELKGKKVATPFSSTSHYSLLNALKSKGLEKDVTLLDMQTSEIVAAWERGDIDGAYTWEPTLSELKETGRVLIDSKQLAEEGYLTANIELVHQDFAKKYPELVSDYLTALNEAVTLYREQPEKAIKSAAEQLEITEEDAKEQMEGTTWLSIKDQLSDAYLGTNDKPGQFTTVFYDTAVFLNEQGAISKVPTKEAVEKFINTEYLEAIQIDKE